MEKRVDVSKRRVINRLNEMEFTEKPTSTQKKIRLKWITEKKISLMMMLSSKQC